MNGTPRRDSRSWLPIVALVSVSLLVAACSAATGSARPTISATGTEAPDAGGGHGEQFSFGMPADPADADRVVEVQMIDPFEFDPAQIQVAAGETITFIVTNTGSLDHEFVIGDEETQDEHEVIMEGDGMGGEDEPNELALAGGESGELTWSFAVAGSLLFGCHVPGHYDAGMVGTLEVAP